LLDGLVRFTRVENVTSSGEKSCPILPRIESALTAERVMKSCRHEAIHWDKHFVLLRPDESDIHLTLDGTCVLAEGAKLSQLRHGDRSPLAEDVPDDALGARRRGKRAGVSIIAAHFFRQEFIEFDPQRLKLGVADLLWKVSEHRLQSLIGRAATQHDPNDRVVVGATSYESMNDVHLGRRSCTVQLMLTRDVEVKLEKLVDIATDRDLASGVVRRSDQDVVASVPDGSVAGNVINVDRLAQRGLLRHHIDGGLPLAAALIIGDRKIRPLRRTGIAAVGVTGRTLLVAECGSREHKDDEQMAYLHTTRMTASIGFCKRFRHVIGNCSSTVSLARCNPCWVENHGTRSPESNWSPESAEVGLIFRKPHQDGSRFLRGTGLQVKQSPMPKQEMKTKTSSFRLPIRLVIAVAVAPAHHRSRRHSMDKSLLRLGVLAGVACVPSVLWGQFPPHPAPIPKIAVTTYHYDNFRSGWNSHELVLNPTLRGNSPPPAARVLEFGLLRKVTLDDTVYAQPLVVPDVAIAGGKHDVVYVVTENNTVYAIDADSGEILLTRNLGPAVPRDLGYCANNGPRVGIESTPVIDLAHNALYLISYTTAGQPIYLLHAIDLTTLKDQAGSPVVVSATHKLTDGSTFPFKAADHRQRAALLFEDGNIYAAFSSWCDRSPARGWLLGWRASDLQPLAANFLTNTSPVSDSNRLSTIWMSGYGVAAVAGHLYFTTGNSPDPTGTSRDDTYSAPHNLSEGVVKVSAGLVHLLDFFTPSDVDKLNHTDSDLGSGGVLLLPDQPGSVPRMAVAAGKDGRMFLLNRDDMGGFSLANNHVLGSYPIGRCWCGQSYYLNNVVSSGGLKIGVWQINTSPSPSLTQIHSSSDLGQWVDESGFFTAVSSNGSNDVIIWAVSRHFSHDVGTPPPTLFAFQPVSGNPQLQQLFMSTAGNWDVPHSSTDGANSNIVPVVANGHVYVASYKELDIFGLGAPPIIIHPAAPRVAPEPKSQPAGGLFGTITKLEGSRFTLKTEAGEVQVNAETAINKGLSPALVVGRQVSVYGTMDAQGVLHAEVIKHGLTPKKP
jgi:hypothetical protein